MARKILTIGITINLENYENLRLEVQGEVGDDGNAEPIIAYLDGMLARLGHGDEATAALVNSYRHRVLAMPGAVEPPQVTIAPSPARKGGGAPPAPQEPPAQPVPPRAAPAPAPAPVQRQAEPMPVAKPPEEEEEPPREEKPATVRVSPEKIKPVKPAIKVPAKAPEAASPPAQAPAPQKGPSPLPAGEARKEPAPEEPELKAAKPKLAEGEVPCEGCGTGITRNQEKLSKLLTGKSLCKRCMNP
jgi:hypothetical protein